MKFPVLAMLAVLIAVVGGRYVAARGRQPVLAVGGASLAMLALHGVLYFDYLPDDAFISFRYAQNFADGHGVVWNQGEHVEGYTNFLWVLTLAGFARTGADLPEVARWLGVALGVAAGYLTYVLATRLVDGAAGRAAGWAAVVLLAANGAWALWVSSGMETGLFALLVVGAALLHVREDSDGNAWPRSGAVWALVAMTRPDGLVFFAVSGMFKAQGLWRVWSRGQRREDAVAAARRLGLWLVLFAILYGPYFLWRYETYGWLIPNTYYAKVGSGFDQYERGLQYLTQFSREYGAWALLAVPVALVVTNMRRGPSLYVGALVAAWAAYVVYVGGDGLGRFRFFAPILPLMYVLGCASVATILAGAMRTRRLSPAAVRLAGLAAIVGLVLVTLEPSANGQGMGDLFRSERQATGERAAVGRWLREHVPADTLIAVVPAGAIPYESRLPTIDMLGLNDEHIAHRELPLGAGAAGHEKYDTEYVLGRSPEVIILQDRLTASPWSRADYGQLRFAATQARLDMLANELFQERYVPRAVEVEAGAWFNLFVREGASDVLAVTEAAPE